MNALRRFSRKTKAGGTTELPVDSEESGEMKCSEAPTISKPCSSGTTDDVDYGYGDSNTATPDYGYGETPDYGYGDSTDYGYGGGESAAAPEKPAAPHRRTRSVRRNSTVIRKDENNPLAVAEYLVGGPPLMSDRDLKAAN